MRSDEGLIAEGEEIVNLDGEPEVKDAALIAAAQRVEYYEIAGVRLCQDIRAALRK